MDPQSEPAAEAPAGSLPCVIVIERDENVRVALTRWLQRQGFAVYLATDRPQALAGPHGQFLRPVLLIEDLRSHWVFEQDTFRKRRQEPEKPT
jgi:ActR/RegA family two-component response regulator